MKHAFIFFILLMGISASAQKNVNYKLKELPQPLEWVVEPESFTIEKGVISITAGPNTNMFFAPDGNFNQSNMPKFLFEPHADFELSAKAFAKHQSKWDAAMLVVYVDEAYWAKFCFENESPTKNRMVTVVTNQISDDAYSDSIETESVYMRISKKGRQIVFSYSLDNSSWFGVRYFRLDTDKPLKIGFASQSPIGKGLTSTFSEIEYREITED